MAPSSHTATTDAPRRTRPGPRPRSHPRQASPHAQTPRARTSAPRRARSPRPVESEPESAEQRRDRVRRSRRWWVLVGLLGLIGGVVAILEAPFFEARSVQISGIARTSEGAVLDRLAIPDDQALVMYSTSAAGERLAGLPWVQEVSVIRQWPSTVRVVIREHPVTAAVGTADGSSWAVLGADRVVVEHRLTPPSGVPLVVAPDAMVDAAVLGEPLEGVERVYALALGVPDQLAPWITTWTLDDDAVVHANLVGSAVVDFGPSEDERTQFVSLASLLGGGGSLTCLREIDLSIGDTPVLHRDPACIAQSRALVAS